MDVTAEVYPGPSLTRHTNLTSRPVSAGKRRDSTPFVSLKLASYPGHILPSHFQMAPVGSTLVSGHFAFFLTWLPGASPDVRCCGLVPLRLTCVLAVLAPQP